MHRIHTRLVRARILLCGTPIGRFGLDWRIIDEIALVITGLVFAEDVDETEPVADFVRGGVAEIGSPGFAAGEGLVVDDTAVLLVGDMWLVR